MLNIAICDDSQIFMLEIQSLLQKDERVGTVRLYSQPELLCADLAGKQGKFDAVLMDIDFRSQKNGFDYAQELYRIASNLPLIYVTGYTDQYAQFAFLSDANLVGYMTKPIDEDVLSQYLDKLAERRRGVAFLRLQSERKSIISALSRYFIWRAEIIWFPFIQARGSTLCMKSCPALQSDCHPFLSSAIKASW